MKPRTFVKALTYEPKIDPVLAGTVLRTTRPLYPHFINGEPEYSAKFPKVGDTILFHGWGGKPYWSPWTWRAKVTLTGVVPIMIFKEGVAFGWWTNDYIAIPQLWSELDSMAHLDGIKDGITMGAFFNSNYKLVSYKDRVVSDETTRFFIILQWNEIDVLVPRVKP